MIHSSLQPGLLLSQCLFHRRGSLLRSTAGLWRWPCAAHLHLRQAVRPHLLHDASSSRTSRSPSPLRFFSTWSASAAVSSPDMSPVMFACVTTGLPP